MINVKVVELHTFLSLDMKKLMKCEDIEYIYCLLNDSASIENYDGVSIARSKFQGHVGMTWAAIAVEQKRHRINLVSSKLINWDGESFGFLSLARSNV